MGDYPPPFIVVGRIAAAFSQIKCLFFTFIGGTFSQYCQECMDV